MFNAFSCDDQLPAKFAVSTGQQLTRSLGVDRPDIAVIFAEQAGGLLGSVELIKINLHLF